MSTESIAKAKEALKGGNWDEATDILTKAIQDADVYTLFATRVQALMNQKKYKAAIKDAQAMTAANPSDCRGYLLQAKLLRTLSKYTAEVEAYRDGLAACDRNDKSYVLLERGLQDARQISKSILNDPRMMELFILFDKDQDSTVDFKEVALGLYQLCDDLEDAQRKAAGLLLMMDENDQRVLTYEQFAKLIMAMSAASAMSFGDLYEQLKDGSKNAAPVSQEILNQIQATQVELAKARERVKAENEAKKTLDALSYGRTAVLFDLWDLDKSGTIDFQELLTGLRKYQRAALTNSFSNNSATLQTNILADVERDALQIMGHDKDSNQELDKEEFAHAIANYAEFIGTDLHELIDFMCVVSSQSETTEYETMYSDATPSYFSSSSHKKSLKGGGSKFYQSLGTILDMGEIDEEEEGE
ncbi:EF hand domain containing protein [Nitzschia inconspicua]|uniref:EF hand domain containing protein n=1 Tax=Nitzschia inconspicua TaxID=303405 RepID=A0A9K3PJY3_9STRA|nr:EF hand domain containing protein [Nitzschia inconspicua]